MHRLFQQGKTSENVTTLLERLQSADPGLLDLDEDNTGQGWGHYQFTAGGISPLSVLTSWQDVGSVATAFKLVAAAIKTCQEAQLICKMPESYRRDSLAMHILRRHLTESRSAGLMLVGCIFNLFSFLCFEQYTLDISSKCLYPVLPTTPPSYSNIVMVLMSPPKPGHKIKFKPIVDVANISEVPAGTSSTHQQPATMGSTEPSATLDQVRQGLIKGVLLTQASRLLWCCSSLFIPWSSKLGSVAMGSPCPSGSRKMVRHKY
jgi:hypothetical protein